MRENEIDITSASVHLFILAVRAGMPDNPYHNWKHVVDVTQVRPTSLHRPNPA